MEKIDPNTTKGPYGNNRRSRYDMAFQDWGSADTDQSMDCPICGFEMTHLTHLEVYARQEDDKLTTKVSVNLYNGKTTIENIEGQTDNPSARRHGQILKGHCESGCNFSIEISQHKGNTFFRPEVEGRCPHN